MSEPTALGILVGLAVGLVVAALLVGITAATILVM